jgi:hypothetical protein
MISTILGVFVVAPLTVVGLCGMCRYGLAERRQP